MILEDVLAPAISHGRRGGDRVPLSRKLDPRVRAFLEESARRRGMTVADVITELVLEHDPERTAAPSVIDELDPLPAGPFGTILADPPGGSSTGPGRSPLSTAGSRATRR
jgi:hypothetical protein